MNRLPVSLALSPALLERERKNLTVGSVVADGLSGMTVGAFCDVTLTFPTGARVTLPARAVLATPGGTVLAFEDFAWSSIAHHMAPPPPDPFAAPVDPFASATAGTPPPRAPEPEAATPGGDAGAPAAAPGGEDGEPADPETVAERLRGLSVVEQLRVARDGSLEERIVLERLYGKTVWEAILRNVRVTIPEVARLAKLGTLPRPLLELVVGNAGWLQAPQVRRALLGNPRLGAEGIQKVLSLVPKAELKAIQHAAAYPPAVRAAAKQLLRP